MHLSYRPILNSFYAIPRSLQMRGAANWPLRKPAIR